MALIRMDHLTENLKVNLPLYLIVPEPGDMHGVPVSGRKVLYLLHGLSDDASAWPRFSTIETVAKRYGLVVVMPSVGRSFYLDQPNGQAYFTYLTEELPRYLEEVFAIRPGREKTLIAGLSMGGYGAFKAALLHPERYFAAASLSGVLSMDIWAAHAGDSRQTEFELLFGDLSRLPGSEHDPAVWLRRAAQNPATLPRLFVACGKQDDLYPVNRLFKSQCEALGVALDYHEADGRHDWPFWDKYIQVFLSSVLQPEG